MPKGSRCHQNSITQYDKHDSASWGSKNDEFIAKLIKDGTPKNTLKAYISDINYFWAWYSASLNTRHAHFYPIPSAVIIDFITDHLGCMEKSTEDELSSPRNNKKKDAPLKAKSGAHKLSTIRRRLSSISSAHNALGLGNENPCRNPQIAFLLSKAKRALSSSNKTSQKDGATLDVIGKLINSCNEVIASIGGHKSMKNGYNRNLWLRAIRDKAILMTGFSGAMRRSEISSIRMDNVLKIPEGYLITIQKSKTDQAGDGEVIPVLDESARALSDWLDASEINEGNLFRGITNTGNLTQSISERTIYNAITQRAAESNIEMDITPHSLRSGFITEAGRQNISLQEAMLISRHKTVSVAMNYHRKGNLVHNKSARMTRKKSKNSDDPE